MLRRRVALMLALASTHCLSSGRTDWDGLRGDFLSFDATRPEVSFKDWRERVVAVFGGSAFEAAQTDAERLEIFAAPLDEGSLENLDFVRRLPRLGRAVHVHVRVGTLLTIDRALLELEPALAGEELSESLDSLRGEADFVAEQLAAGVSRAESYAALADVDPRDDSIDALLDRSLRLIDEASSLGVDVPLEEQSALECVRMTRLDTESTELEGLIDDLQDQAGDVSSGSDEWFEAMQAAPS